MLETDLSQSVEVLSPGPGRMRDTRSKSVVSISPPTAADQVGIIEDQTVQRPVLFSTGPREACAFMTVSCDARRYVGPREPAGRAAEHACVSRAARCLA